MSQINEIKNEQNAVFDIIQAIQSKLNENQKSDEIINAEENNIKKDSSKLDLSSIMSLLAGGSQNAPKEKSAVDNGLANLDINTIVKAQQLFATMNQDDPRKNLLTSLKPFLRQTRQKNVDTYISIIGILKAINIFYGKDSE